MSKVMENIYGILDKTGDCPFFISFYKEKKRCVKRTKQTSKLYYDGVWLGTLH